MKRRGRDVVPLSVLAALFAIGCADETRPSASQGLTVTAKDGAIDGSFVGPDGTSLTFTAARDAHGDVSLTVQVDGFVASNQAFAEGGGSLDTNGAQLTDAGRSTLAALAPSLESWMRAEGFESATDPETAQALLLTVEKLITPGVVEAVQRYTSVSQERAGIAPVAPDGVISPQAICWGYYYTLDGQCRASSGLYQNARNTCGSGWPSTIQWQTHCGGGPDPYYHWYIFTCCSN